MLCRNCKKCKGTRVGYVSHRYWCSLTGDGWNGKAMGVYPWLDKPHPKCPLKGLSDTHQKTTKEVNNMRKTKAHYLNELERMFKNKQFQDMRELLGTGICDSPCHKFKEECPDGCSLFAALTRVEEEQSVESLNELNTEFCLYLKAILKNKNKK